MTIKAEDRVMVYATLNGSVAESKGTVRRSRPDGMFYVDLDGRNQILAHPKQCRKLVRKPRKRIWIAHHHFYPERSHTTLPVYEKDPRESVVGEFMEFVEVKKPK